MDSLYDLTHTSTIFDIKPDWSYDPRRSIIFDRDIHENSSSAPRLADLDIGAIGQLNYVYRGLSKAQQFAIESFFIQQRGRWARFWLPVWGNLFQLVTDIALYATYIDIKECGYRNILSSSRNRIYIELQDGSRISRRVNSITLGSNIERLNLNTVMDQTITRASISQFSFLFLVRFDQDEMELTYEGANCAEIDLSMAELVNEYDEEVIS